MPPASTATVSPSAASAERCAAPSMPNAPRRTPPPRRAPPDPRRGRPRRTRRTRWRPWCRRPRRHDRKPRRGAPRPTAHSTIGSCACGRSRSATAAERVERQQRPFGIVRGDQPSTHPFQQHLNLLLHSRSRVSPRPRRATVPSTAPAAHTFGRLHRADPSRQRAQLRARRLRDARQIGPRTCDLIGHRAPPFCRKLNAVVTSSNTGDVRPARSAQRPSDPQAAIRAAHADLLRGRAHRSAVSSPSGQAGTPCAAASH